MKALRDVDFDGIVIPDHVPGMVTADGSVASPGRSPALAYSIAYMRALRDRANREHKA